MTTIKTLINIEDILLNADSDFRYEYSLGDLILSEKYLKEIGAITSLFFSVQLEYSKINEPNNEENKQKLVDYHNKLISDPVLIDITDYLTFIDKLKPRLTDEKYVEKLKNLSDSL